MNNVLLQMSQPEYHNHFVNYLRDKGDNRSALAMGYHSSIGAYDVSPVAGNMLMKAIAKESDMYSLTTNIHAYSSSRIFAKDCDDLALFVEEGGVIPVYDGLDDFHVNTVDSHKLAVFVKLDADFVHDAAFSIEDYLTNRLGKNFGRAEDKAIISGNGEKEPIGILHDTKGAKVGKTTSELTYDDVVDLFFSVKPEYRKHGTWIMNDETALALRKLKDADGNYIWNHNNDTILGKPVQISEFMPSVGAGAKPIAFGDFSYYWFIRRSPIAIRTLTEKFAYHNQIGYLRFEFLDGKLIRPEAVKVLQIGV